jgi:hypothetical protein
LLWYEQVLRTNNSGEIIGWLSLTYAADENGHGVLKLKVEFAELQMGDFGSAHACAVEDHQPGAPEEVPAGVDHPRHLLRGDKYPLQIAFSSYEALPDAFNSGLKTSQHDLEQG